MDNHKTEQEQFWAGQFGDEYIDRNPKSETIASRIALFAKVFARTQSIHSVIEFGSNIGSNLKAIQHFLPDAELSAIEINDKAVSALQKWGRSKIYHQSIIDFQPDYPRDLAFTCGVLIHINPNMLPHVYDLLFQTSKAYVCIIEYYNPTPVELPYRGHHRKLFKRDFAGEMLDKFEELQLIDYGFVYHRDNNFPLDNPTWFLLEKRF